MKSSLSAVLAAVSLCLLPTVQSFALSLPLEIRYSRIETESSIFMQKEDGTNLTFNAASEGDGVSLFSSYLYYTFVPTYERGNYRVFASGKGEGYMSHNYFQYYLRADAESDDYGEDQSPIASDVTYVEAFSRVFVDVIFSPTVTNLFFDKLFIDDRSGDHSTFFVLRNLTKNKTVFRSSEIDWTNPGMLLKKGNEYQVTAYAYSDVLAQDDESEVFFEFRTRGEGGPITVPSSGSGFLLLVMGFSTCALLRKSLLA